MIKQEYVIIRVEKNYLYMARIAGVDLPRDKRVEIGLTYIYGIGRTSADRILQRQELILILVSEILQMMK